jgi:hypothetical protein
MILVTEATGHVGRADTWVERKLSPSGLSGSIMVVDEDL